MADFFKFRQLVPSLLSQIFYSCVMVVGVRAGVWLTLRFVVASCICESLWCGVVLIFQSNAQKVIHLENVSERGIHWSGMDRPESCHPQ